MTPQVDIADAGRLDELRNALIVFRSRVESAYALALTETRRTVGELQEVTSQTTGQLRQWMGELERRRQALDACLRDERGGDCSGLAAAVGQAEREVERLSQNLRILKELSRQVEQAEAELGASGRRLHASLDGHVEPGVAELSRMVQVLSEYSGSSIGSAGVGGSAGCRFGAAPSGGEAVGGETIDVAAVGIVALMAAAPMTPGFWNGLGGSGAGEWQGEPGGAMVNRGLDLAVVESGGGTPDEAWADWNVSTVVARADDNAVAVFRSDGAGGYDEVVNLPVGSPLGAGEGSSIRVQEVPLDSIDVTGSWVEGQENFSKVAPETMGQGWQTWQDTVRPAVASGAGRDYFRVRDQIAGDTGPGRSEIVYDAFYGDEPIRVARRDGRLVAEGGFHRLFMARELGLSEVPVQIIEED